MQHKSILPQGSLSFYKFVQENSKESQTQYQEDPMTEVEDVKIKHTKI